MHGIIERKLTIDNRFNNILTDMKPLFHVRDLNLLRIVSDGCTLAVSLQFPDDQHNACVASRTVPFEGDTFTAEFSCNLTTFRKLLRLSEDGIEISRKWDRVYFDNGDGGRVSVQELPFTLDDVTWKRGERIARLTGFRKALRESVHCLDYERRGFPYSVVNISAEDGEARVEVTDAIRFIRRKIKAEVSQPSNFKIPLNVAKFIHHHLKAKDNGIVIFDHCIMFGQFCLQWSPHREQTPQIDYDRGLQDGPYICTIDRRKLLEVMKTIYPTMKSRKDAKCFLTLGSTVEVEDVRGNGKASFQSEDSQDFRSMLLDVKFLYDLASKIGEDRLDLYNYDPVQALVVKAENLDYFLMPMRR